MIAATSTSGLLPTWAAILGLISSFLGVVAALAAGMRWLSRQLLHTLAVEIQNQLAPVKSEVVRNGGDSQSLSDTTWRTEQSTKQMGSELKEFKKDFEGFKAETKQHWELNAGTATEAKDHAAQAAAAATEAALRIDGLTLEFHLHRQQFHDHVQADVLSVDKLDESVTALTAAVQALPQEKKP